MIIGGRVGKWAEGGLEQWRRVAKGGRGRPLGGRGPRDGEIEGFPL